MTKYFTILIVMVITGILSIPNTYAFSTHDYFQNIGVTYELTASDHTMINTAVAKIEAVITNRGESFRSKIVSQLREYSMAKFNNNVRMSTIFGEVIASLKQTGKDKAVIKTATGTTVYTQAESLLKNGARDLRNLSVADIKRIADDKSTIKLLLDIEQKLQGDTLSACVDGTSGDDQTMTCDYEKALDYLKYLYLSSKNTANYSMYAENRAYSNESVTSLETAIKDVLAEDLSGSPIFYGIYSNGKFYKMEITLIGHIVPGGYVIFSAHPDPRQL